MVNIGNHTAAIVWYTPIFRGVRPGHERPGDCPGGFAAGPPCGQARDMRGTACRTTHVACLTACKPRRGSAGVCVATQKFSACRQKFSRVTLNFSANPLAPSWATNTWKQNSKIAHQSRDIRVKPYIKNPFFRVRRKRCLQKTYVLWDLYALWNGTSSDQLGLEEKVPDRLYRCSHRCKFFCVRVPYKGENSAQFTRKIFLDSAHCISKTRPTTPKFFSPFHRASKCWSRCNTIGRFD